MDEQNPTDQPLRPEVSEFLNKNVSYLALAQMTTPAREIDIVIVSALIDTLVALREIALEGEGRQRVESAWSKLAEVFPHMENLEKRTARIFDGRYPWDTEGDARDE
ncbi:hypothetical protein ACIF8Z_10250 [Pseudomonas promysalinigenes]|uniref:hypothetical protein n=1 Tax=Pseudomonas promysalinigenes TaxID=485898 RepID=UPI0037CC5321